MVYDISGVLNCSCILGPTVSFKTNEITVSETIGSVDVAIIRKGDLSTPASVRIISLDEKMPDSAEGCILSLFVISKQSLIVLLYFINTVTEDYQKMNEFVNFQAGQEEAIVTVTIIDDENKPIFEGNETLHLVLQEPVDVSISEPKKLPVIITDVDDSMFSLIYFMIY